MDDLIMSQSAVLQYLDDGHQYYGTGNRNADLKTWLSATISHQYTCIEEFQGVQAGLDKIKFVENLQLIALQVSNILGMISDDSFGGNGNFRTRQRPSEEIPVSTTSVVVAKDGSGNFTSISDAVLAAPTKSKQQYIIYIKKGIYKENVEIQKDKWNLMLIGDGVESTIISGDRSVLGSKFKTYNTATLAVNSQRFVAQHLTVENTAGPNLGQAVALRSNSDLSVFYKCRLRGYQDTLYVYTNHQFYRECEISGTVDFIFGKGSAVFQNCNILVRRPGDSFITAHGQDSLNQITGFSIQFSDVSSEFIPNSTTKFTYLGRPWSEYARTVFMQSYISGMISPEGWKAWNNLDVL